MGGWGTEGDGGVGVPNPMTPLGSSWQGLRRGCKPGLTTLPPHPTTRPHTLPHTCQRVPNDSACCACTGLCLALHAEEGVGRGAERPCSDCLPAFLTTCPPAHTLAHPLTRPAAVVCVLKLIPPEAGLGDGQLEAGEASQAPPEPPFPGHEEPDELWWQSSRAFAAGGHG